MLKDTNGTTNSEEEFKFSCYSNWGVSIATISAVTFIVNIFHLVIISRMRQLQGRPYRLILIHITLADIGSSLFLLTLYSCLPGYYVIKSPFVSSIVGWPLFTSHWIFLLAGIEQYYSICRPLLYETVNFVQKLFPILVLTWMLTFCWSTATVAIDVILRSFPGSSAKVHQYLDLAFRYGPLILAAIPLTLVLKELTRMRQMAVADRQKQSRRAAVFLIMIYSLFTTFSVFELIMNSIAVYNPSQILFSTLRLKNVTKCFYGIINTVIYGFRTKA